MTKVEDIVSMIPIYYIKEYHVLMDSSKASDTNYSNVYSQVKDLRSNLILDMTALDEYEKTIGRVYTQFNTDYQTFFLTGEVYLVAYIIGIFILSRYAIYYLYK